MKGFVVVVVAKTRCMGLFTGLERTDMAAVQLIDSRSPRFLNRSVSGRNLPLTSFQSSHSQLTILR